MFNDSKMLSEEQSLFAEPQIKTISKSDFVNYLKAIVEKGGEISWLSTESRSFEWSEINENPKKFLKDLEMTLDYKMVDIGIFYPKSKETEYSSYKIE